MILSVHAIFGAAVASLIPDHPFTGFALGFASHLVLDAIPHRDYDLVSVDYDSNDKMLPLDIISKRFKLIRDIIFVSGDAVIGLGLSFIFFFNPLFPLVFLYGAIGAILPDFFTFLYLLLRRRALHLFFNFHSSIIHSKTILKLNELTGVIIQYLTVAVLIVILFWVRNIF